MISRRSPLAASEAVAGLCLGPVVPPDVLLIGSASRGTGDYGDIPSGKQTVGP
jgi:hypothetical protein